MSLLRATFLTLAMLMIIIGVATGLNAGNTSFSQDGYGLSQTTYNISHK